MIPGLIALVGCAVLLIALAARNAREIENDWTALLASPAGEAYEYLLENLSLELKALNFTFGRAAEEDVLGHRDEALRLLAAGYRYLARVTTGRLRLLQRLLLYSRMVEGLAPLPRFRRRLWILRRGLSSLTSRQPELGACLEHPAAFRALGQGSIDALLVLLLAIGDSSRRGESMAARRT